MLNHTYSAFQTRRKPLCALIDALSSLHTSFLPLTVSPPPSNPSQPFSSSHLISHPHPHPHPLSFVFGFLCCCILVLVYWCISLLYIHTRGGKEGELFSSTVRVFMLPCFFWEVLLACLLRPPFFLLFFSSFFFLARSFLKEQTVFFLGLLSSSSSIQRGYVHAIWNLSCVGFSCMLGLGGGARWRGWGGTGAERGVRGGVGGCYGCFGYFFLFLSSLQLWYGIDDFMSPPPTSFDYFTLV